MDNINFESLNASQGSRIQSQPQPQPFNIQDMNMSHYNQSSPWTTETFSSFPPFDCSSNQSLTVQCSSSRPYSSFHPYHHQSSDPPSLNQPEPMVHIQPLPDQYSKPLYQRSCANDFAATNSSPASSYSLSFEASQDPHELCKRTYSNSNVTHLNFSSANHQPKQNHNPRFSSSPSFSNHGGSVAPNCGNKTRIRWTQDLHEKFMECVNRLGGADSKSQLITFV